jgi:predicted Zn-dependent protease
MGELQMRSFAIAASAVALLITPPAEACTTNGIPYPQNDLDWRQQQTSRNFWIATSVPTGCQNAVYVASTTWTNSAVNVRFVWSGYVNNYAYAYDSSTGQNFSLSTNTLDTWVQIGTPDVANYFAQTFARYADTNYYNAGAVPPYTMKDSDVVINNNRMSEFYCGTDPAAVPSTQRDLQSTSLHEYGHVWGLGHDCADASNSTVMYEIGVKGTTGVKRALTTRDVARAQSIYGAK